MGARQCVIKESLSTFLFPIYPSLINRPETMFQSVISPSMCFSSHVTSNQSFISRRRCIRNAPFRARIDVLIFAFLNKFCRINKRHRRCQTLTRAAKKTNRMETFEFINSNISDSATPSVSFLEPFGSSLHCWSITL